MCEPRIWHNCAIVALLALAAGLAYWAISLRPPENTLPLDPSPKVYDFGKVRQAQLEGEFTLTNCLERPIQTLHVVTTCTCQEVKLARTVLEAGGSVKVPFRWDTRRQIGESQTSFAVAYKVMGGDETLYANCTVRGNIIPPFQFEPKEFLFSSTKKEIQTAVVKFASTEIASFALLDATCPHAASSPGCDLERNEVILFFDPDEWENRDVDCDHKVRLRLTRNCGMECSVPVRFLG